MNPQIPHKVLNESLRSSASTDADYTKLNTKISVPNVLPKIT